MSRYEPLWLHLESDGRDKIILSFDNIEKITGFKTGHEFLTYKKELKEYGYKISKFSLKEEHITFTKIK